MADLLVFPQETVLRAIEPGEAIERVRDGFVEYAGNEWQMPPKVYLDASPNGDFRAMPAKGAGLAILKWVTSFPGNPEAGLPVVMGMICVSSAVDGEPLALVDVRAVTALRTGAVAAVAAQELAREDARTVGMIGFGLHGPARRRARLGRRHPGGRARVRRRHLRHPRPRAGRPRG
jgi:alanine dehydrogenase